MPVQFELVRRPNTGKLTPATRAEIRKAFADEIFPAMRTDLNEDIKDWSDKPDFKYRIEEKKGRIDFVVYVDMSTETARKFVWSDKGTGLEGPKKDYYRIPAVNVPLLKFVVPYQPRTFPVEPLRYDPGAPPKFVQKPFLMHPGIQARGFSEKIKKKYGDPREGKGVFQRVRNAFMRAFRKVFGRK